jgi:hypothetical protein
MTTEECGRRRDDEEYLRDGFGASTEPTSVKASTLPLPRKAIPTDTICS